MKTIALENLPGFTKCPHRRWFYVQRMPSTNINAVMKAIIDAAQRICPGGTLAVIEERVLITLPTGELLQGLSFKTEHAGMEDGIREYTASSAMNYGELDGFGIGGVCHSKIASAHVTSLWKTGLCFGG